MYDVIDPGQTRDCDIKEYSITGEDIKPIYFTFMGLEYCLNKST